MKSVSGVIAVSSEVCYTDMSYIDFDWKLNSRREIELIIGPIGFCNKSLRIRSWNLHMYTHIGGLTSARAVLMYKCHGKHIQTPALTRHTFNSAYSSLYE